MNNKHYTQQELNEMRRLKAEGKTFKEIAQAFNRSEHAIAQKFSSLGWMGRFYGVQKWDTQQEVERKEEKPKVTLKDFQPREIIKYLYSIGYRIENNQLVCHVKQVVNMKSILEE